MTNSNSNQNEKHDINNMQVYIADLADYNNGILRGFWLDLRDYETPEEVEEVIQTFLSKRAGHEEWAIHDYNGFPNLGEYASVEHLMEVADLVKIVCDRTDDEIGPELASQYIGMKGEDYATKESFEEEFQGIFKDEEDFGIELIRECYDIDKMMGSLAPYFDYAAYARDLFLNGDYSGIELHFDQLAVFSNH